MDLTKLEVSAALAAVRVVLNDAPGPVRVEHPLVTLEQKLHAELHRMNDEEAPANSREKHLM